MVSRQTQIDLQATATDRVGTAINDIAQLLDDNEQKFQLMFGLIVSLIRGAALHINETALDSRDGEPVDVQTAHAEIVLMIAKALQLKQGDFQRMRHGNER